MSGNGPSVHRSITRRTGVFLNGEAFDSHIRCISPDRVGLHTDFYGMTRGIIREIYFLRGIV